MFNQTVKQMLDHCVEVCRQRQGQINSGDGSASREFALAITAIEEAQMRYTRGRAIMLGKFAPADLDAE
jgi:hypothetical protein